VVLSLLMFLYLLFLFLGLLYYFLFLILVLILFRLDHLLVLHRLLGLPLLRRVVFHVLHVSPDHVIFFFLLHPVLFAHLTASLLLAVLHALPCESSIVVK